jgi:putative selenate reductase
MRREAETSEAIFDLPRRKWHIPDPRLDLSAVHFSRRAATPVGPAAGPHTQMAQNIVLSWLGGGRIIELKTVQVNDRLRIPRPCIHVPNIGYNVEWSQELRVPQSLREYAKAAYLIEILKATRSFSAFPSVAGFDTVFDISVGYDLEGIRSDKVTGFMKSLKSPSSLFDELRSELDGDLAEFRDVSLPEGISDCVTLSTFHGCPPREIESIARYLLEDLHLHVIIKLNPTLLGFQEVTHLLHERLGYTHLRLRREAFEVDLQYDEGLEIFGRLQGVAESVGSTIGAKFTNTLVVENEAGLFPSQTDPYMYVSGPPLHVISMNLMQRFREDVGFELPVSFSAGIDARNFPAAVACGMVPVTTCTDLLKQGGYGRLPRYLKNLGREMERCGVTSREAYVLAARGQGARAVSEGLAGLHGGEALWRRHGRRVEQVAEADPDRLPRLLRKISISAGVDGDEVVLRATRVAGRLNGRDLVPSLAEDSRYFATANAQPPRGIESVLSLYDCINCDLCISACPNDAIFGYSTEPRAVTTSPLRFDVEGNLGMGLKEEGAGFRIVSEHQLAVLGDACNECSNCEVYCPEEGAPFREKERVFLAWESFRGSNDDGFLRSADTLHARVSGQELLLQVDEAANRGRLHAGGFVLDLRWEPLEILGGRWLVGEPGVPLDPEPRSGRAPSMGGEPEAFDTRDLWRLKTVWENIFHSARPNPVNPDPGARSHATSSDSG